MKKAGKIILMSFGGLFLLLMLIFAIGVATEGDDNPAPTETADTKVEYQGFIPSLGDIEYAFAEYSDNYRKDMRLHDRSPEGNDNSFLVQVHPNISLTGARHPDNSISALQVWASDNGNNSVEILATCSLLVQLSHKNMSQSTADSIVEQLNINSFMEDTDLHRSVQYGGLQYIFERTEKTVLNFTIQQPGAGYAEM